MPFVYELYMSELYMSGVQYLTAAFDAISAGTGSTFTRQGIFFYDDRALNESADSTGAGNLHWHTDAVNPNCEYMYVCVNRNCECMYVCDHFVQTHTKLSHTSAKIGRTPIFFTRAECNIWLIHQEYMVRAHLCLASCNQRTRCQTFCSVRDAKLCAGDHCALSTL